VVVTCPKCKAKLKVDETKLSPTGSRFKCPKCSTVLLVKKPAGQTKKVLDTSKVLVAHSNQKVIESASAVLKNQGYKVIASTEGIDAMVKAMKEFPFVVLIEVSLPKIYGFEVCRKLKAREEAKNMKFILVPSIFDKSKYRREPASLYGADDYIEPEDIPDMLAGKVNMLANKPEEGAEGRVPEEQITVPEKNQLSRTGVLFEQSEIKKSPVQSASKAQDEAVNEVIEKAKRLSRTIVNDIFLYNSTKVINSIRSNTFLTIFAAELREGQKLYENRIPLEIRNGGNYYSETIEEFISKKKKELN
jgi:predicted Zn finger-like uncharacterized protein